jgi:hypothetical protein
LSGQFLLKGRLLASEQLAAKGFERRRNLTMAGGQSATNVFHPATVQIGTRTFSIDSWPLPHPQGADRRTVELNRLTDDCMVLEPKKWTLFRQGLFILAMCAAPMAVLVFGLVEAIQDGHWVPIFIWSIGLLLVAALLLSALSAGGRWVRFDRRAGLLTISRRPFGFRRSLQVIRSRPLTDLVCVQLLYGGYHSDSIEIGEPGTPGSVVYQNYHSYQLNLVFDDPNEPRYKLASQADWKWIREAGQQLADFAGVPVVDQLYHGT